MRNIIFCFITIFMLAACQTTNSYYGQWQDISPQEAILKIPSFEVGGVTPKVKQKEGSGARQEWWSWDGGELNVYKAYSSHYMTQSSDDNHTFVKSAAIWKRLQAYGIALTEDDVKRQKDRRNNIYPYAVVNSKSGSKICFIASRAIGTSQQLGGGNIQMYMCANSTDTNEQELAELGNEFLATVSVR